MYGCRLVGVVSRRWVWLLGVVVRRYIDFLILLIPTPLVLFYSSIPTFCSFKKMFLICNWVAKHANCAIEISSRYKKAITLALEYIYTNNTKTGIYPKSPFPPRPPIYHHKQLYRLSQYNRHLRDFIDILNSVRYYISPHNMSR